MNYGSVMRSAIYPVLNDLLEGTGGPMVAFVWGMAEALFWPIIPDYFGVAVIPVSPRSWWVIAFWLTMGSVTGGVVGYWLSFVRGTSSPLESMPLVTSPMIERAKGWLSNQGAAGIFHQPLSGVPYKVFVYLGGSSRLPFFQFVVISAIARGARMFLTSAVAGGLSTWAGATKVQEFYDVFLIVFSIVFAYGLYRVVKTR